MTAAAAVSMRFSSHCMADHGEENLGCRNVRTRTYSARQVGAGIAPGRGPSTVLVMSRGIATPRPYMELLTVTAARVRAEDTVLENSNPDAVRVKRQRRDALGALGWRLRYSDPRSARQPERTFYGSYGDAVRELADFERTATAATVAPTVRLKAITVQEWAIEWLRMRRWKHAPSGAFAGERRPHSTFAKERSIVEAYLLPGLGPQTKLRAITLRGLREWIGGLTLLDDRGVRGDQPMAPSSKTTVANVVKLFFRDATRELGLSPNPAAGLPTTWGTDTSDRRILVPNLGRVEELACALDEAWPLPGWAEGLYGPNGEGRGDIVRLLAFSGMRWEESAAMPSGLVHRADKLMTVRYTATESGGKRVWVDGTKTGAGERHIVIVPQLHDVIDRLDAVRARGLELEAERAGRRAVRGGRSPVAPPTGSWSLLVSGERGGFVSYGQWRKELAKARAASGVDLTAHELRHVAASILYAALGADWSTIKEQMGHKSAQETERIYVHVFRGDRARVARMLGAKIEELRQDGTESPSPHQW